MILLCFYSDLNRIYNKILSGFDNHAIVAINSAPKAHKAQALKLDTAFFGYFIPSNINDAKIKPSSLNLELVGIIFAPVAALSHIITCS